MKTTWKEIAFGLGGATITLAGTLAIGWFGHIDRNRELDIRMVDVALTILAAKDDNTHNKYAKRYALDLLEKYGGQPIANKNEWESGNDPLPIGKWPATGVSDLLRLGIDSKIWKKFSREGLREHLSRLSNSDLAMARYSRSK